MMSAPSAVKTNAVAPSDLVELSRTLQSAGSLQYNSALSLAARANATRGLVVWLRSADGAAIEACLSELAQTLLPPLLDGSRAEIFAATASAVQAIAERLGERSLPLVSTLLPLLIDQAGCTSAASTIGAHAHGAVCAILPHVPTLDIIPALLGTLSLPAAPPAARKRLTEQVLLALLLGSAAGELRGVRRAPIIAKVLCTLLHEPLAGTRRLARHALLVLMESFPRSASEPFGRLPLRTQRQLTAVAKRRALALGPPLLPPPPPPPPVPQAVLLQAAARGLSARRRARAAAAFLSALDIGHRLSVHGHTGVLRFRGTCSFALGPWLGVELDRPCGKHDGAYKGERYFRCAHRHGVFVRPGSVTPYPDDASAFLIRRRAPPSPPYSTTAVPTPGLTAHPAPLAKPPDATAPPPAIPAAPATPAGTSASASSTPRRTPMATPGPARSAAEGSSRVRPAFRTLLESHKRVLGNIKALCDGELALVKAHELAARLQGEAKRPEYLRQMQMLCQQQRLLVCQLCDAVLSDMEQDQVEAP
jgi:hypothetical protein